jgi:glycosyltransferase involved in cell wall biosynthesis
MNRSDLVVVADVNTIWRARPFIALGAQREVLGLAPVDAVQAWRRFRWPITDIDASVANEAHFTCLTKVMLPGWASATAKIEQPRLWKATLRAIAGRHAAPSLLVVTIPHYLPLLEALAPDIRTAYYASDDYRRYEGWDPAEMERLERAVIERVDLAIFVSKALASRARTEHPGSSHKIHVSMNATEQRFFGAPPLAGTGSGTSLSNLPRPIAGVIGAINERLDFELLRQCASADCVGTLLFVGPVKSPTNQHLLALHRHPKCVFVGEQPHASIPAWMHFIDVALIPYKEDPFNYFCSPMRLFDHLASGKPIVATDACDQMRDFSDVAAVGSPDDFVTRLEESIQSGLYDSTAAARRVAVACENTWSNRATALNRLVSGL